jgi:hypothetical protein
MRKFQSVKTTYVIGRVLVFLHEAIAKVRNELLQELIHGEGGHGIIHFSCVHLTEKAIHLSNGLTEAQQHSVGGLGCRGLRGCS